jgi:putative transposase
MIGWLGLWWRLSKDRAELPEIAEAVGTLAMIRLMVHGLAHAKRGRPTAP